MFLVAAVLAMQTPTLPADAADAGLVCARLAAVKDRGDTEIGEVSRSTFYLMQAARLKPTEKLFLQRVQELGTAAFTPDAATTPAVATALIPACEQRFVRSKTVDLPADPFQRDIMCVGAFSLLMGFAQGIEEDTGNSAPRERVQAALVSFSARLSEAELVKHGVNGKEQFEKLFNDQLAASSLLGEPVAIASACGISGL